MLSLMSGNYGADHPPRLTSGALSVDVEPVDAAPLHNRLKGIAQRVNPVVKRVYRCVKYLPLQPVNLPAI